MMQLQQTALSLLQTISSGASRQRPAACIRRYQTMAAVPSVSSVLSRSRQRVLP